VDTQAIAELEKSYQRGEFGRVVYSCDELLRDPAYGPARAQILLWKGLAKQQAGHAWYGEAISCFREGISAAGRDRPLKARLIATLSAVYALTGDCVASQALMKDYERVSREANPGVSRWGAFLWYNYGCTLDNAFRYQEAAAAFARAAALAQSVPGLEHVRGWSLHNLGGVQLALNNLPAAADAMEQAESLLLPDPSFGPKRPSRRAEYQLAAGDMESALQHITAALALPQVDDMTRADVYYTWARVLQAVGRPTAEVREKALLALDCAVKAVHYPGIDKTNRLLQQLGPARKGD